ncbi:MAG: hypothetical protein Phyf2KO_11640 [Phycisphaerales bacterium]
MSSPASSIERQCDVLIIGGGIAGISIAERLAREARRKSKAISIIVVDRETTLGTQTSGGLEGWLHTGVLYTKLEDPRTFTNCMNALEDLVNWYALDDVFHFKEHCNLRLPATGRGRPERVDSDNGWFADEIEYEIESTNESTAFNAERARFVDRSTLYFLEESWQDSRLGVCRAPHFSHQQTTNPSAAQIHSNRSTPTDLTMNAGRILADLASAAAQQGVEFLLGYDAITIQGSQNRVRLSPHGDQTQHITVDATQVIHASGQSLNENTTNELGVLRNISFTHRQSVMLVVTPAINSPCFARIGAHDGNDLNHVIRRSPSGNVSVIADSNTVSNNASEEELTAAAMRLKSKLEACFSHIAWNDHQLVWYTCRKVECSIADGEERDYSFWWGPTTFRQTNETWQHIRKHSKGTGEQAILDWVLSGKTDDLPAPIESDWWSIRKAIHFATLSQIHAERHRSDSINTNALRRIRQLFPPVDNHRRSMFVVPGKFSLFPSVAHQTFIEMEIRGLFDTLKPGMAKPAPFNRELVSKPAVFLAGQQNGRAHMSQWNRNSSECV